MKLDLNTFEHMTAAALPQGLKKELTLSTDAETRELILINVEPGAETNIFICRVALDRVEGWSKYGDQIQWLYVCKPWAISPGGFLLS